MTTLSEERKLEKYENFFADVFFTDEYSYQHFFDKQEHLVLPNLKIPLVYLFNFKFD